MNRSPKRAHIRVDARLDDATRHRVDDFAHRFHTPRAAVLCHIMHWGLSHKPTTPIDRCEPQGPVRHLHLCVPSELHAHVQQAAAAAGLKLAAWLRQRVRQVTSADFPASWQDASPAERTHDSRTYPTRFMLRLDEATRQKLEDLSTHFDTPAAEVIRHLIAQATPEEFPTRWPRKTTARHRRPYLRPPDPP